MSGAVQPNQRNHTPANESISFLSLAAELRNKIYEEVLAQEEPIDPSRGYNRERTFTTGLLGASKFIHYEASSVFYGQHRFYFTKAYPELIASFLKHIGSNNAGYIRHIIIEFPQFRYLDPGDVTLEVESVVALMDIKSRCTNWSTLTTSLDSTNSMERRLDNLDHLKVATEAIALVDTCFRAMLSIKEVILEVYDDGPLHIRSSMERHGWTLHTAGYVEEDEYWDAVNDHDIDDYGYDYG